eukprot:14296724-Ditylum_brightwellii.AAC.1
MALDFQTTRGVLTKKVIQLPSNKAQLHLSEFTITSQYSKALHDHATKQPLWDHLNETNGWDEMTINKIDWKAFASERQQHSHQIQQIVKLPNGILPTNKQIN